MTRRVRNSHQRGFTLTELLVALTLNAVVVAGALTLHQRSGQQYRHLQAVAELEERATFAMRALVSDTRLAGFLHIAAGSPAPEPSSATCNGNSVTAWALNHASALQVASGDALPCRTLGRAMPGSDVLVTRHLDAHSPVPIYQAHAWYIDTRSSERGLPSLRRQTLLRDGRVQNQEIMPGVESLQVTAVVDSDGDHIGDTLQDSEGSGALAVIVEIRVRSAGLETIRSRTVRRLITLRNG